MNGSESLSRLAEFADVCLLPWTAPARHGSTGSRAVSAADAGRALEAVLWLRLGVQLELFPEDAAWRLLEHVRRDVYRLLSTHAHVVRPVFSEHHWQVLLRSLSDDSGRFVTDDEAVHRGARGLAGSFAAVQGLRLMTSYSNAEPVAAILTFGAPSVWRRSLEQDELFGATMPADPGSFLAGVILLVMDLVDLDRFAADLEADPEITPSVAIGLMGEVCSIQAWRLNLHATHVHDRFREAVRAAVAQLPAGAREFERVLDDLEQLIERWRARVRPVRAEIWAAASAPVYR